jgi:hypothetical protein
MRKLLSAIFGTGEHTGTVLKGIDAAWFTSEEKSEFFLKYLASTQPQNLARRLIAFIVVMLWAFLVLAAVASYKFDSAFSEFIFDTLNETVNTPFSIIIGFYFAAHLARSWQSGKQ